MGYFVEGRVRMTNFGGKQVRREPGRGLTREGVVVRRREENSQCLKFTQKKLVEKHAVSLQAKPLAGGGLYVIQLLQY
ncbi:hypothetical protein [Halobacillus sp. Marseille-P3879]|uniref:hypothetical protein n=1 Tax=Halobacillus sp. Marseille-P3879 TaxID=2045014 RepID=UPI000C7D2699|nr:hypothetical protein [Halobacillus sp. Marseille-P3879]